uniref:Uncharacterized protein n=1 Tax=viral metagenome TaxID=1070528 RepID=A0A6H1ZRJ4_9ZZZZ
MTENQVVRALGKIGMPGTKEVSDPEVCHVRADQLLIEFLRANGFGHVANAWENTKKRIGFWYA